MDDIMESELRYAINKHLDRPCRKKNLMWIQELKDMHNYQLGDELQFLTKQNADGHFNIHLVEDQQFPDLKIHKDGYAELFDYIPQYSRPSQRIGIIAESLYNDSICDSIKNPYGKSQEPSSQETEKPSSQEPSSQEPSSQETDE